MLIKYSYVVTYIKLANYVPLLVEDLDLLGVMYYVMYWFNSYVAS